MSTDEAADLFGQIVQDAPYNLRSCPNPAGGRIFRVNSSGRVQELNDAGEWADPTGDATIPPVPAREGGTAADQICLASENAASVLQQLYENITDSFNASLDEAEALTALVLLIISIIGAEFAPITYALVTFFSWLFSVLYATLEFVGADLWDETFTQALVCILLGCASNDDGVVTFDWDCFNNALASQVNVFDLTTEQLRLFGQLQYLLSVIGGVDALNAAGATTAITVADCVGCDVDISGQITFDAEGDTWTLTQYPGVAGVSTLDTGFGQPAPSAKSYLASNGMWEGVRHDFPDPVTLTDFDFWYYYHDNTTPGVLVRNFRFYDASNTLVASYSTTTGAGAFNTWQHYSYTGQNVHHVSYFIVSTGVSAGAGFSGETWIDNIAWAGTLE